jgi:thiosulfate/3-mercaptopyruvate sulfurtransferase
MLAKHGIRHDTTVILYGRDVYAAARVAQIMLYAGVKDVRLLDGGWKTWSDAGLPVERGMPPEQKPAPDFGAPIPGQPQLMLNMEQARAAASSGCVAGQYPFVAGVYRHHQRLQLYQAERRDCRRPLGHAGSDSTHMEDFHNPDGTMRSADDIAAMWRQWNILPNSRSRSTAAPAGAPQKPLCTPARWAGKTSRCTTAAGTNGAATRKPGADRRARSG